MIQRHTIKPQIVTQYTDVQCYGCGWKGMLAETKQSIYIDFRKEYFIPASHGGNGTNYRCPICGQLIFFTRNDHTGKDKAPQGHQYRQVT